VRFSGLFKYKVGRTGLPEKKNNGNAPMGALKILGIFLVGSFYFRSQSEYEPHEHTG
jgi:hypothetical protein